ncbi:hypothetical protein RND71_039181 [Anisodus tanguticus]|uniref:Uncharacterized protein n=1 Tax=Anisodus tanguticus TaxID=243964 RepID=A0AAE1QW59_9SOLA|nr:hypothetical protein RND71_039181 [Anisodus tanguticus]
MRVHIFCPCNDTIVITILLLLLASPTLVMAGNGMNKLRKLPHVFGKVLELPIPSDADVEVEENPEFFRFVVKIEQHGDNIRNVRAEAVEIHPGVTKIVVRYGVKLGGGEAELLMLERLKVDTWRFRLPASTKPEMASAVFVDGELMVTVPKGVNNREGFGRRDVLVRRGDTRLVLVQ